MKFSETLLQYRKARGLSQEALAGKIGVSRQAVSKWETGEALPDLQKAVSLADALGISLDELCGKESASSGPAAIPTGKRHLHMVFSALCLFIGIVLGGFLFRGSREEAAPLPQTPALPAVVSVSDISFVSLDGGKTLSYSFVPSVAGDACTYRISFTDGRGETLGFDAVCRDGICTGTVRLPSGGQYNVAATVNNGVEERAFPLARELSIRDCLVTWIPW